MRLLWEIPLVASPLAKASNTTPRALRVVLARLEIRIEASGAARRAVADSSNGQVHFFIVLENNSLDNEKHRGKEAIEGPR